MGKALTAGEIRHFREQGWTAPLRAMSAEDADTLKAAWGQSRDGAFS